MPQDTLTVVDNRTGEQYELPITTGTIRALDLRQIKVSPDDFGLMSFDPAFTNTASCRSQVTFIDGERGILLYRGFPIEQLAKESTYLETAYLTLNGELPNKKELDNWAYNIKHHTLIHENIKKLIDGFHHDAHPMGMLVSIVGALSTFYPESKNVFDREVRMDQAFRLIAKLPTIAAFCYRHSAGLPYSYPDNDLSYAGNFLNMLFKMTELKYKPHPVLERALEVLFILHADHEQNCSTNAMRSVGSSQVDPYAAIAARDCRPLRSPPWRCQRSGTENVEQDRIQESRAGVHQERQAGRRTADGIWTSGIQVLRSASESDQADGRPSVRGNGTESTVGRSTRTRAHCAQRRLFRIEEIVPQRGFLLRSDLSEHEPARGHVSCHVRDTSNLRMARSMGRNDSGCGTADRKTQTDLHWAQTTRLHSNRAKADS